MMCKICGLEYSSPSFGGPGVCPACDCGIPPEVLRLKARVAELETALREVRAVGQFAPARKIIDDVLGIAPETPKEQKP